MLTPGIGPRFLAQNTPARWRTLRTLRVVRHDFAQCFDAAVENGGISSKNGARTALVGLPYRRFSPTWGWDPYQDPLTGTRIKPGTKLGDAYHAASLPVAKRRLYQAGVRLATILNEVLGAEAGQG
jgi:hypothetical protein